MHLVIYNCGTGDSGLGYAIDRGAYSNELQKNNVQTIMVNGCHHEEVCGTGVTPDLDEFANRFIKKVFTLNETGQLVLAAQNSEELITLGVGIQHAEGKWIRDDNNDCYRDVPADYQCKPGEKFIPKKTTDYSFETQNEPIESITFIGYSRGGVTCFNMAKVMDKIHPNVPVHIVADQPVPGNIYALPGTNAATIADCSKLKNLKSVDVSIGAYTGILAEDGVLAKLKGMFHRLFFSQIIPQLPKENCQVNLSVIPRTDHWGGKKELSGSTHLNMHLTQQLANRGLLSPNTADRHKQVVVEAYEKHKPTFPDADQLQTTFGANKAQVYDHVDKIYLSKLNQKEYVDFLTKWWEAQETQASRFSTQLTKDLLAAIKAPDNDSDGSNKKLLDIFKKTDEWLMLKMGSGSSRYEQVQKMREQVREWLLQKCDNKEDMEKTLLESNLKSLQETHFFERQWQRESRAASWFKTSATKELDKAFQEHANAKEPSEENDKKLLKAMDKWLQEKTPEEGLKSTSSRYDIVANMRNQLASVIEKYPKKEANLEHSSQNTL